MGLSSSDFVQIYERGISLENIKSNWAYLKTLPQKMVLVEPIFLFKGILKLSESDFQQSGFFLIRANLILS
jgi:hypothetical protein